MWRFCYGNNNNDVRPSVPLTVRQKNPWRKDGEGGNRRPTSWCRWWKEENKKQTDRLTYIQTRAPHPHRFRQTDRPAINPSAGSSVHRHLDDADFPGETFARNGNVRRENPLLPPYTKRIPVNAGPAETIANSPVRAPCRVRPSTFYTVIWANRNDWTVTQKRIDATDTRLRRFRFQF